MSHFDLDIENWPTLWKNVDSCIKLHVQLTRETNTKANNFILPSLFEPVTNN